MTSMADPLVGQLLDGRYRIHDPLARGGMACVYQATDTRLDRPVALKAMHAGLATDADAARNFETEARAAAQLSHPNVVSVFDQGSDDGRPYIVMELIRGHTLRSVISQRAPLDPAEALGLLEPVLNALACAHRAGLVHRDVKPENVLISDDGQIKVGDFGLARAASAQTVSGNGLLMGTLSYLSPELVTGGQADARSDVYSAGIMAYELLTGQKPHTGETPIQVAYGHVHNDVPAPSTTRPAETIPDYLDALVIRATARNPDDRPHDAGVWLTQLRQVASALRAGLDSDPELSQDLTVPLRSLRSDTSWRSGERADTSRQTESDGTGESTPPPHSVSDGTPPGDEQPSRLMSRTSRVDATRSPDPDSRPRRPNHPRHRSGHRAGGLVALIVVLLLTGIAVAVGWYIGGTLG
jgi:serine/threonine-protein kinase